MPQRMNGSICCIAGRVSKSPRFLAVVATAVILSSAVGSVRAQPGSISNEVAKLLASNGAASDNFGNTVAVNGATFVVGARFGDGNATNTGSAYVFVQNASGVATEQARLVASDGAASDGFGWSVGVSGDTAVVGSIFAGGTPSTFGAGAAYVYVRDTSGVWTQQARLTAFDGVGNDLLGSAVAMNGDTIVVGSPKDDDACPGAAGCNSGSAYVFVRNPSNSVWTFQAKLVASDQAAGDRFGSVVSISADTIAVGSLFNANANGAGAGAAYVFVRDANGAWTQQAKLTPADGAPGDLFGVSIAVNGDTVVGGANHHDDIAPDAGAAYVFVRDTAGVWTEQTKLLASDAAATDWFGWSVGITGDVAVVSARLDDTPGGADTGSAYVYSRDSNGAWTQQTKLLASDGSAGDWLGMFLAVSGAKAIFGASKEDNTNGADSGSAYIFDLPAQGNIADLNGDGVVNGADLATLLTQWGTNGPADLNNDGVVNGADLATLLTNWG